MAVNYQDLLDTLVNAEPDNASVESKKNALRTIATALSGAGEPDGMLRGKAMMTLIALDHAPAGVDMSGWLRGELNIYKADLQAKLANGPANGPPQDEEMAGGRKRRRGKKTKSKTKKTRRYTRRR